MIIKTIPLIFPNEIYKHICDLASLSNDDFHILLIRLVDLHVPLKTKSPESINFIENNDINFNSASIAEVFSSSFSNAVRNLKIKAFVYTYMNDHIDDNYEPINQAIRKYENHPSILKINVLYLQNPKSSPLETVPTRIIKEEFFLIIPKV